MRRHVSSLTLFNTTILMEMVVLFVPILCSAQQYTITTVAGGGTGGFVGPATGATVQPVGLAVDAAGNLYIPESIGGGDGGPEFISEATTDGNITIIAGTSTSFPGFSGDGGPATNAMFNFQSFPDLSGIAVDSAGNIYVADTKNLRVREITTDGNIRTIAGGASITMNPDFTPNFGDGGQATLTALGMPEGLAVDAAGNLYIADKLFSLVRKVAPDGTISTIAGCEPGPACPFSLGDGGPATKAMLTQPTGVAVDPAGNVYVADTGHNRIRKISGDGTITTVAGSGAGSFQGDGGPATSAGLFMPNSVAVDSAGNIYIGDNGDYRVRMVTPDGTITTIAGNGTARGFNDSSGDGGPGTSAKLSFTAGVVAGQAGTVYVADVLDGIRLLTPVTSGP